MTKLSEFSWARVLSASKQPSVDPIPADPTSVDTTPVESAAPSPLVPAQSREQAYEDDAHHAPQAAIEPVGHDELTESPAVDLKAAKLIVKRPYSARKASDKKRWRWARERVIQALYQQILNSTPVDMLDAQFMEDVFMLKVDLELFRRIVRGVSANEQALDMAFTPLLDRPLAELDPIEHAILRMGAFELIYTPEIPRAVAINEAVEMAKLYGASESHKYVNGVLDKLADHVRQSEPRHPASVGHGD